MLMSHFATLVLIPPSTPPDAIDSAVAALLEPFDENTEVEAYPTDCYCKGSLAQRAGRVAADQEVGPLHELNERYWALPEAERPELAEFLASYQAVADRVEQAHPLYQKPDPACKECHGTGNRLTTYNPDSQWDWWVIGGRWDGWLHPSNVVPVSDLLPVLEGTPFALVTPDGAWHQQGRMGLWGMASDEAPEDEWADTVQKLLRAHPGALAVTCDLHI